MFKKSIPWPKGRVYGYSKDRKRNDRHTLYKPKVHHLIIMIYCNLPPQTFVWHVA